MLSTPDDIESVVERYLNVIHSAISEFYPIHRLAFIEKDSGPVGALTLKDLLIVRTRIPGVIIRVQRRESSPLCRNLRIFGAP